MFSIFNRKCSVLESGILAKVEDRHSHILYGVDDGVRTEEDSLAILAWMRGLGLRTLWLTPHIMEDIPNTTAALRSRFDGLVSVADTGGISIHLAAEYMIDNLFERRLEEGDLLCMEDNMVLMETSIWSAPYRLSEILDAVMRAGYRPLLAHPERYRYMEMKDYRRLADMGVRLQMNLPSLIGCYGRTERDKARKLLADGMYSYVGSDCHSFHAVRRMYSEKSLERKDVKRIEDMSDIVN